MDNVTRRMVRVAAGSLIVLALSVAGWAGYNIVQISVLQKVNLALQNSQLQNALKECREKGMSAPPSMSPGRQ